MATDKESSSAQHTPYFAKWEIVLVFLSLIVSTASLWMSIRTEKSSSAPNVQIQSVEGSRSHMTEYDEKTTPTDETVSIRCTVVVKNSGRAAVQIVNVRWEPVSIGDPINKESQWLAISDGPKPILSNTRDYFYQIRTNPVLGIHRPVLEAGEAKTLELAFEGKSAMEKGQDTPNVRVIFVFSNGQELTVLPEIKYSGVGGSFHFTDKQQ